MDVPLKRIRLNRCDFLTASMTTKKRTGETTMPESGHYVAPCRATIMQIHARFEQIDAKLLHIVLSNLSARDFHRVHFTPHIIVTAMTVGTVAYTTCAKRKALIRHMYQTT